MAFREAGTSSPRAWPFASFAKEGRGLAWSFPLCGCAGSCLWSAASVILFLRNASSVLGEGPVTVADTSAPPAIANGGTCLFDGSKTRCPPCCSGSDASIPSGEGGSGSKQGFVESQQTAVRVTILEASWKTAFGRSDTDAEHEPLP